MPVSSPTPEDLLAAAQKLPGSPQTLLELGSMVLDVNSLLEEVAQLLKRDAALAARMIRLSNSAAFGGGGRIGSIESAVERVGFGEVYRLTGFAAATQMSARPLTLYGLRGTRVRDNTLFCALAMESLARRTRSDPRAAYTAGLMRSAGKLVLGEFAQQCTERPAPFAAVAGEPAAALAEWEMATFGVHNGQVATQVLASWSFPEEIVAAVGGHYLLNDEGGRMTRLLHAAAGLASAAGYALPGEADYWTLTPPRLEALGLIIEQVQACGEEATEAFAALQGSLD